MKDYSVLKKERLKDYTNDYGYNFKEIEPDIFKEYFKTHNQNFTNIKRK